MNVTTISKKQHVLQAISDGLVTQAEVLAALGQRFNDAKFATAEERARSQYCDDDLEIDDCPMFSEIESGVWVSAWVFVYDDDKLV